VLKICDREIKVNCFNTEHTEKKEGTEKSSPDARFAG
jgi:hypothetical protein